MKRIKYPEHFERLWKSLDPDYGTLGNKKKAFEAFTVKEIDEDDVDYILGQYEKQRRIKEVQRMRGDFSPDFPHIERYIRDERFDDEISIRDYKQKQQGKLTKSDQADNALREYLARSYGEGMEDATGDGQDSSRGRLN